MFSTKEHIHLLYNTMNEIPNHQNVETKKKSQNTSNICYQGHKGKGFNFLLNLNIVTFKQYSNHCLCYSNRVIQGIPGYSLDHLMNKKCFDILIDQLQSYPIFHVCAWFQTSKTPINFFRV